MRFRFKYIELSKFNTINKENNILKNSEDSRLAVSLDAVYL